MRNIFIILFFGYSLGALAQLEPLSNQYLLNTLAINPAYAGSHDALSISLFHRNQWTGFDGAPKTVTLAMHSPMRNEKVGLGIMAVNDRSGISSSNLLSGNFAYRIRIDKGIFSFGLGGGISVSRLKWQSLVAVNSDDELLRDNSPAYILPNFSLGVYYNSDRVFLGVSLPMLLSHEFNSSSGSFDIVNDTYNYNYFINGGYLIHLSSHWKLLPSAMIRFTPAALPQADLNSYIIYGDRVWAGISYRSNKSVVGLLMYQVNNQLSVAYSYDIGLGKIGGYMGGSHEIMIRYDFRYIVDVMDPRYF
jgi:type IX secretion system PorP/SprF family membrane protein